MSVRELVANTRRSRASASSRANDAHIGDHTLASFFDIQESEARGGAKTCVAFERQGLQ